MSLFDSLRDQLGGLDLAAIGQQVGLTPEQVQTGAGALLPQIADPNTDNEQATAEVAAQTGIPHESLSALTAAIIGHAQASPGAANSSALSQIVAGIPQAEAGQQGGLFSRLAGIVDRDGDGNPINDLSGLLHRS